MALNVGQVLNNRYRIVRLLGQGGFGAVYRAWDTNLNIPCAVKESFDVSSSDSTRQFAREANILASLRHPNLPKVTDYFSLSGQGQYLVMEFIEGESLEDKLERAGGPLPEAEVIPWMLQILDALAYLHTQTPPIIHRDIKPPNVRITPQGQAVLVDFGIAKFFNPNTKTTLGARAVTPGYSPFEQYGQGATDARSDIYALGAMFYHLLTGQRPPESIERVIRDRLTPPQQIYSQLSPGVCEVIARAMTLDPDQRWQSAAEFKAALKAAPAGGGASFPALHAAADDQPVWVAPAGTGVGGVAARIQPPVAATQVITPPSQPVPESPPTSVAPAMRKSGWMKYALGALSLGLLALCGLGLLVVFLNTRRAESGIQPTLYMAAATSAPTRPAAAAPPPAAPGQSLKIGLLIPLSGQIPTFGVSAQKGAQLAVDEWNQRGGVLNRKIELRIADGQCSADPAQSAATKLIDQDGVKYIVGEICSSASIRVAELANRKGVLQITPTSTNSAVTVGSDGRVRPFTFRACFIDAYQGQVMAKFAKDKGYQNVFILYDPLNNYVLSLSTAFEQAFIDAGGKVAGKVTYSSGDTDFSAIIKDILDSKAQAVYLPDYYNVVNLFGAQAKKLGMKAVLLGGDGWDSADLDVKAADGGFYTNHYDPGSNAPAIRQWINRYQQANSSQTPDAIATLTYDAVNVLLQAIAKTGADDPAQVKDVLASASWDAVTGPISFDALHNPFKSAVIIGIANGQKTYATTITP